MGVLFYFSLKRWRYTGYYSVSVGAGLYVGVLVNEV